jgi:hypothetical protein
MSLLRAILGVLLALFMVTALGCGGANEKPKEKVMTEEERKKIDEDMKKMTGKKPT